MISRLFIGLLSLVIMIGCTPKESIEPPAGDMDKKTIDRNALLWVFKPDINIRGSASSSGDRIMSLADGDSVIVLSNVDGWYQIKTIEGQSGWIRSDLLGPKELSAFRSAVTFIEELKTKENIELYFDKKLYHKRIYISYPSETYSSRQTIEEKTRDIIKNYQQHVYRGPVTARILKPGTDEEYMTLEFEGAINADPILPIIPFGRIEHIDREDPRRIKLIYSVPAEISNDQLIETARQLVPKFPISYQRIEITFKDSPYSPKKPCRLWYVEDKNGEDYRIDKCN
jgi:hypothetical protein